MGWLRTILAVGVSALLLPSPAAPAEPESAAPAVETFGAPPELTQPTSLSEVMRSPERFAGRTVLLHGELVDVCQRKGCWTILRDGPDRIRVRFLDYAFFLPRDAVGAEAFVEGAVGVRTLSEKEARHYEAESRSGDPDAIRGPQREIAFTASGVRLVRPGVQPEPGER